jgi:hypothetical protein
MVSFVLKQCCFSIHINIHPILKKDCYHDLSEWTKYNNSDYVDLYEIISFKEFNNFVIN